MVRFLAKRTVLALFTLWGVTVLIFILFQALPGDAAISLLGSQAGNPEAVARMRSYLGLDRPAYIQYFVWLGDLLQGDLGQSARFDQPVSRLILDKALNSIILLVGSAVVMFSVGIPLGIVAALSERSLFDRIGMGIIIVLGMVPIFWFGLLLIYLFALVLDVLPASRMYSFHDSNRTLSILVHLVLPAITTATISTTILARVIRASLLETLEAPFMQALIARGIPVRRRIWRHAMRNILPIIGQRVRPSDRLAVQRRDLHGGHLQLARHRAADLRRRLRAGRPRGARRDSRRRRALRARQSRRRRGHRQPRPEAAGRDVRRGPSMKWARTFVTDAPPKAPAGEPSWREAARQAWRAPTRPTVSRSWASPSSSSSG